MIFLEEKRRDVEIGKKREVKKKPLKKSFFEKEKKHPLFSPADFPSNVGVVMDCVLHIRHLLHRRRNTKTKKKGKKNENERKEKEERKQVTEDEVRNGKKGKNVYCTTTRQ